MAKRNVSRSSAKAKSARSAKPSSPSRAKGAARTGSRPTAKKASTTKAAPKKPRAAAGTTTTKKKTRAIGSAEATPHVRVAPAPKAPAPASELFAIEAARLLSDDKCTDIVLLDVRGKNPMTDYLVIGSGTSDRQMRSVLQHVEELGEQHQFRAVRTSSDERATWLLADFIDVIVHLFEPNTRAHYDLEMMWGDVPRVSWERSGQEARDRAGLRTADEAAPGRTP